MNSIRTFEIEDEKRLREIHAKYFSHEFSFPDFTKNFLCAFTVEDEKGIVTVAGIRPIAEVIAVTDLGHGVRARMDALYHILAASKFVAQKHGFDQIHAFVQNQKWLEHLIERAGFGPTKGKSLVLNI